MSFRPLIAGDRVGILHLLCNPVSLVFGRNASGDWAYTFWSLMAAISQVDGWGEHAVTDLSYFVTHPKKCYWAIVPGVLIIIIVASIRAVLSSPGHVIVLYGEKVENAFLKLYKQAMPGASIGQWTLYKGVEYAVLTIAATASSPAHRYWLSSPLTPPGCSARGWCSLQWRWRSGCGDRTGRRQRASPTQRGMRSWEWRWQRPWRRRRRCAERTRRRTARERKTQRQRQRGSREASSHADAPDTVRHRLVALSGV